MTISDFAISQKKLFNEGEKRLQVIPEETREEARLKIKTLCEETDFDYLMAVDYVVNTYCKDEMHKQAGFKSYADYIRRSESGEGGGIEELEMNYHNCLTSRQK